MRPRISLPTSRELFLWDKPLLNYHGDSTDGLSPSSRLRLRCSRERSAQLSPPSPWMEAVELVSLARTTDTGIAESASSRHKPLVTLNAYAPPSVVGWTSNRALVAKRSCVTLSPTARTRMATVFCTYHTPNGLPMAYAPPPGIGTTSSISSVPASEFRERARSLSTARLLDEQAVTATMLATATPTSEGPLTLALWRRGSWIEP